MSTIKANNLQVGNSGTATNNFAIFQPTSPDGTIRIANGNIGSTTDVGQFTSSGDFKFNSGYGSVATAYGCRAWVNFNGTGTVAIRASGNVSSITDNNVGNYTVNFTNTLSDANYAKCVTASGINGESYMPISGTDRYNTTLNSPTTSAFRIYVYINNVAQDPEYVSASIFR